MHDQHVTCATCGFQHAAGVDAITAKESGKSGQFLIEIFVAHDLSRSAKLLQPLTSGNDALVRTESILLSPGLPWALVLILRNEDVGVSSRTARAAWRGINGHVTPADGDHAHQDGTSDRAVGAGARCQITDLVVQAQLLDDRAGDEDGRKDLIYDMELVETRIRNGLDDRHDDREPFRFCAGHDRCDGDLLHGSDAVFRLHDTDDLVARIRRAGQHPIHSLLCRRCQSQAVADVVLHAEFHELFIGFAVAVTRECLR